MAPCKRQVKAMRHLVCNHCHSLVDFAVSWCGKSWSETTEEGFTFQCLGCWKVDCLTAELARLTDIVKGIERGDLDLTRDLTRLPPRDSTLDGRWTRKPFGLSRVQPIYLSIPRPS